MGKEKDEKEIPLCPVGKFFSDWEKAAGKKSEFFEHLSQSRIEFLKAIKSLVEERLESFDKKGSTKRRKKVTKVEVE